MSLLDQYQAERNDLLATIQRTLDAVEGRDLSDAETRSITDARARMETLDAQIALVQGAADLTARIGRSERRERTAAAVEARSFGEQFVASEAFTEYRGRGVSPRITVETRALPTGLPEADALYRVPARVNVTPPTSTPLLDAIPTIGVSSNAIETVLWEKVAGGAAKVAEKAPKPSAEFAPTVVSFTLDTIAAYTQLTRQLIEDEPAVRDAINSQLMRDVVLKMEAEAAAAIAGATLPTATSSNLVAAVRKGVGVVQGAGYMPNAVILNPADWADMDIEVFLGNSAPGTPIQRSFWGLTPIAANSQPAGTATVADLGAAVQRYARSGVSLYITDSHEATFTSNVFTILAEGRARTIVTRPDAAVDCSVA